MKSRAHISFRLPRTWYELCVRILEGKLIEANGITSKQHGNTRQFPRYRVMQLTVLEEHSLFRHFRWMSFTQQKLGIFGMGKNVAEKVHGDQHVLMSR